MVINAAAARALHNVSKFRRGRALPGRGGGIKADAVCQDSAGPTARPWTVYH